MFPDFLDYARYFKDWMDDIWFKVRLQLTTECLQTSGVITAAATVEEVDRPDGKPPPASAGK